MLSIECFLSRWHGKPIATLWARGGATGLTRTSRLTAWALSFFGAVRQVLSRPGAAHSARLQ